MGLEPDVLRADQSGFFPVFDNEDPSEKDFSQFYSRLQYHISKVYSTSEFKQAEEKWKEWQNPITLSVSTKYSKRIQMEETKLDEDFINTQNTILKKVYTDRLLFIPDTKSRKAKKKRKGKNDNIGLIKIPSSRQSIPSTSKLRKLQNLLEDDPMEDSIPTTPKQKSNIISSKNQVKNKY